MQRRGIKNIRSFPEGSTQEAERLRAEAEKLRPGPQRHARNGKARRAETAAYINKWLKSPGLRLPE
jgi:hypothetical protein